MIKIVTSERKYFWLPFSKREKFFWVIKKKLVERWKQVKSLHRLFQSIDLSMFPWNSFLIHEIFQDFRSKLKNCSIIFRIQSYFLVIVKISTWMVSFWALNYQFSNISIREKSTFLNRQFVTHFLSCCFFVCFCRLTEWRRAHPHSISDFKLF